jgi:hypothetical protein
MNVIIEKKITKTAQISLISFFIHYKDKMNENIIHKRKVLEQQGEIEWENYQADVELAIENH